MRFATVTNANHRDHLEAYLPSNYKVLVSQAIEDGVVFIIGGEDNAGWTLDEYVIPRLGSGLIFAEEIENYAEVDNTRYAIFEGVLVIVEAIAVDKVQVRTINDGGLYPSVNGIPVEFRIWVKELKDARGDSRWQVDYSSIYRKDESWPKDEPTSNQVSKIYDFAKTQASHLSMHAKGMGQVSWLDTEIRNMDRNIERLQEDIKDLEEKRHELEKERDSYQFNLSAS